MSQQVHTAGQLTTPTHTFTDQELVSPSKNTFEQEFQQNFNQTRYKLLTENSNLKQQQTPPLSEDENPQAFISPQGPIESEWQVEPDVRDRTYQDRETQRVIEYLLVEEKKFFQFSQLSQNDQTKRIGVALPYTCY